MDDKTRPGRPGTGPARPGISPPSPDPTSRENARYMTNAKSLDLMDSRTRKGGSITDNIFLYNRAPIAWKSKLQKAVSLSIVEAEYYSGSLGAVRHH